MQDINHKVTPSAIAKNFAATTERFLVDTPIVSELPISSLHPFAEHPYRVVDDEAMDALVDSIRMYGVIVTLLVRPLEDTTGQYEVISGHRRLHAARRAGLDTVPAVIEYVDRDTAAIEVVDSNLHREHILPSEKVFAYEAIIMMLQNYIMITNSHPGKETTDSPRADSAPSISANGEEAATEVANK